VFVPAREVPRATGGITLEGILWSLHSMTEEVTILPELAKRARAPIQKMLELAKKSS
jgi:quinolinate synthase